MLSVPHIHCRNKWGALSKGQAVRLIASGNVFFARQVNKEKSIRVCRIEEIM
jgi:hypothetical protein